MKCKNQIIVFGDAVQRGETVAKEDLARPGSLDHVKRVKKEPKPSAFDKILLGINADSVKTDKKSLEQYLHEYNFESSERIVIVGNYQEKKSKFAIQTLVKNINCLFFICIIIIANLLFFS